MDARARKEQPERLHEWRMERTVSRVLIVGGRGPASERLAEVLEVVGHTVETAAATPAAVEQVRQWRPDIVLLSLDAPATDGYQLLRLLRDADASLPLLLVGARADETDTILALRLGADGYVTSHCGPLELLARLEALRRRCAPRLSPARETIRAGELEIEPAARQVRLAGAPVALSPKEFDLLLALARRGGALATREELLREIWHGTARVGTRAVDLHVRELRRKLERDPEEPRLILTVRKKGYRLAMPTTIRR